MVKFSNSPGPKYRLPTTTGFDGHDPTMTRAPALSIATPWRVSTRPKAPGPHYNCTGMTNKGGTYRTREAYLEGKPVYTYSRSPGAQSYGAHLCPDTQHERPPSWYILGRTEEKVPRKGPAPKYKLRDIIGGQTTEFPAAPQYSILGRDAVKMPKNASPGPGRYGTVPIELHYPRAPTPQIFSNQQLRTDVRYPVSPAPKYKFDFNEKKEQPSYSFGVRHSDYQKILYTQDDSKTFYGF